MQINSISSNSIGVLPKQQGIQQLTDAVTSNNIEQAKQIFQSLFSNSPAISIPSTPLYSLNQALQSGDALQAQLALINIRSSQQQQNIKITPTATLPNVGKLINTVA